MENTLRTPWFQLTLLAISQWLALTLWFSASAVVGLLKTEWQLDSASEAWLTISVQLGFVLGSLTSAIFNLPDRGNPCWLFAGSAFVGALANTAIVVGIAPDFGRSSTGFAVAIVLRMVTGITLAGVYPTGMKLAASWFAEKRGLAIGVLVGALTIGSASPHLVAALAVGNWRAVMLAASACAILASIIGLSLLRPGPQLRPAARFDPRYFAHVFRDTALRRANFGYLGHMFELYAMWTWAPKLLSESLADSGWTSRLISLSGFVVIAVGGIGSVIAGWQADRVGRTTVTIVSLLVSGSCALLAGHLLESPTLLLIVCLLWGFSVVADSAQFSASVSELCDPTLVGTALTIQTCTGFLLTTVTIRLVPTLRDLVGWPWAMSLLAVGPAFGIWHLARLRWMPESIRLARGHR